MKEKKLVDKKILFIIASKNFRDEEYFIPYEILQNEGADITTASSIKGEIVGVEGGEARSKMTLKEVEVRKFDAVMFVGGSGAIEYFDDNEAHRIIQKTVNSRKVLAAICIAPIILARSGVLKGKKATVWSSLSDKVGKEELEKAGCNISDQRVVTDERIITADGPSVASDFANAIIYAMTNECDDKRKA
ncbi:MAG: DJ-1/PfpI family protein [Candidatus Pacebacteria bacterium]|nr:DJ-1/PfpI family protein [Candidatus Paceibacterota bacterium]